MWKQEQRNKALENRNRETGKLKKGRSESRNRETETLENRNMWKQSWGRGRDNKWQGEKSEGIKNNRGKHNGAIPWKTKSGEHKDKAAAGNVN